MTTVKERVYAAAETMSAEKNPTVAAVREKAGVSMADASRYVKEWRNDRDASTRQMIAAPPAMVEQGQRLAAAIWDEAIKMAEERHGTALATWEEEKASLTAEVAELVDAADAADTAHRQKAEADATALSEAHDEAASMVSAIEAARAETTEATAQNTDLREQLAAAQARVETLQRSMDAVIARIPAPAPDDDTPDTKS